MEQQTAAGSRAHTLAAGVAHGHRTTRNVEANALHLIGDIAARRELPALEEAVQHYRQALALADELGMRPLVAHCHLGLGALYRQLERLEPARGELSAAVELFRSMGMTFWLPTAEAELAKAR